MKPRYTSIIDGKPVFNEAIIGLINRAKQRPNIPAYARLLQLYNQIMGINWGTVTVTIGRKKLNSGTHTQLRLDFDAAVDNARRHEAGMRRARIAHSDDELEHFGIQGMKWGVRRYQNEDGTLTEAGRKRYGVNEKQARKLIDAEKKSPSSFNAELFKNKAVDQFRRNNPESLELRDARIDFERAHATANNEANLSASRAVGGRSFKNLLINDPAAIADYMSAGRAYMESPEVKKRLGDADARLDKAERAYEKKGKEFINQLLGEYGKLEMENEMSLAYDTKQKKIRKQTLSERAAFELYRSSGGRIAHSDELAHMDPKTSKGRKKRVTTNSKGVHAYDELEHFGIQGMKWGVRRYQNEDGSLTEAGRKRYGVLTERYAKAANRYERASAKGNAVKAAKAGVKLTKANTDLHSFNQRLGYEAKYPDKDPLKGMQNKLPDKPQQSQINYNPQQSQNNNNQQQFQKPAKVKPEKPYWKKKVKDMDDAELKAYAERLATLEKLKGSSTVKPQTPVKDNKPQGKDADKKTNNGQNFVIQKGKKFGNKIVDTMVEGAGKRIGEYYLDRLMGDKFKKNN